MILRQSVHLQDPHFWKSSWHAVIDLGVEIVVDLAHSIPLCICMQPACGQIWTILSTLLTSSVLESAWRVVLSDDHLHLPHMLR
jgi:hypothetical protein